MLPFEARVELWGMLRIPQSSTITGISPSDCLVSYLGHSLVGGASYPSAEMQLVYSPAPADLASVCVCVCLSLQNHYFLTIFSNLVFLRESGFIRRDDFFFFFFFWSGHIPPFILCHILYFTSEFFFSLPIFHLFDRLDVRHLVCMWQKCSITQ